MLLWDATTNNIGLTRGEGAHTLEILLRWESFVLAAFSTLKKKKNGTPRHSVQKTNLPGYYNNDSTPNSQELPYLVPVTLV